MGKRLARRELFQEIKVEREALDTLLKQIKPRQMTLPGVTAGGWSVKDILGDDRLYGKPAAFRTTRPPPVVVRVSRATRK